MPLTMDGGGGVAGREEVRWRMGKLISVLFFAGLNLGSEVSNGGEHCCYEIGQFCVSSVERELNERSYKCLQLQLVSLIWSKRPPRDLLPPVLLLSLQEYTLTGLKTYTQYLVSLRVFNPEGDGPETIVVVMTDEGGEFRSGSDEAIAFRKATHLTHPASIRSSFDSAIPRIILPPTVVRV